MAEDEWVGRGLRWCVRVAQSSCRAQQCRRELEPGWSNVRCCKLPYSVCLRTVIVKRSVLMELGCQGGWEHGVLSVTLYRVP